MYKSCRTFSRTPKDVRGTQIPCLLRHSINLHFYFKFLNPINRIRLIGIKHCQLSKMVSDFQIMPCELSWHPTAQPENHNLNQAFGSHHWKQRNIRKWGLLSFTSPKSAGQRMVSSRKFRSEWENAWGSRLTSQSWSQGSQEAFSMSMSAAGFGAEECLEQQVSREKSPSEGERERAKKSLP